MKLPQWLNDQQRLLSINVNQTPGIDCSDAVPGLTLWPLYLDEQNGVWVLYARYAAGMKVVPHFHGGQVHFFTTKGRWNYLEYPQDEQTAGSYLYEPAGAVHTFSVPEDSHGTEGFMVAFGVNISFDDQGKYLGTSHAGSIEQMILEAARTQGIEMPSYLKPAGPVGFTT